MAQFLAWVTFLTPSDHPAPWLSTNFKTLSPKTMSSFSVRQKKTATSAHTIVCFRTNKDDAPDMATLFTGIKRRPTIILTDPLEQKGFEEHPKVIVREFYRNTISVLEAATKRREKEATGQTYREGYSYDQT